MRNAVSGSIAGAGPDGLRLRVASPAWIERELPGQPHASTRHGPFEPLVR